MVAVAYRRWSFTRGSNCKAFTGKILVFWISAYMGGGLLTIGDCTWRFDRILLQISLKRNCYVAGHFFPKSARSHWLIRGHMTSNVETVSRQKLPERVTLQNLWRRRVLHYYLRIGTLRSKDAKATRTSLKKGIFIILVLIAIIPTQLLCQM